MNALLAITKEIKTIKDMIQDSKKSLNDYTDMRDNKNESDISDTQTALIESDEARIEEMSEAENALCELSEEIDERLSDIENALCELSE